MTNPSTSAQAHAAVEAAWDFTAKNGLILLTLFEAPNSLPGEIATALEFRPDYVKPRLSQMKDYGLVRETTQSSNPDTGRTAHRLDLTDDARAILEECLGEFCPLETAKAVFLEFRSRFNAELESMAKGLMTEIAR